MDMTKFAESEYLTADKVSKSATKKGYIIGDAEEVEGKFGSKVQLLIEIENIRKKWNPNKTSVQNLIDAFGTDSKKWLGKEVIFSIETTEKGKQTIIGKPVVAQIEAITG